MIKKSCKREKYNRRNVLKEKGNLKTTKINKKMEEREEREVRRSVK